MKYKENTKGMGKSIAKSKKAREKMEKEIVTALPSFINQLLLMLTSGMVLQEAMARIAVSYSTLDEKRQNTLTRALTGIYENYMKTGENMIKAFHRYGRESRVKELARVAGILEDGEKKGVDLWDKLADEGEELWAERKRLAMEQIRLAESKMSFPLALLLLALILITAAPAMLQMYIN